MTTTNSAGIVSLGTKVKIVTMRILSIFRTAKSTSICREISIFTVSCHPIQPMTAEDIHHCHGKPLTVDLSTPSLPKKPSLKRKSRQAEEPFWKTVL